MTDRELMQMALDALKSDCDATKFGVSEALCARLAQPEPVIYARKEGDLIVADLPQVPRGSGGISNREWVGLTDEEQEELSHSFREIINSIDWKLKKKNGGSHD